VFLISTTHFQFPETKTSVCNNGTQGDHSLDTSTGAILAYTIHQKPFDGWALQKRGLLLRAGEEGEEKGIG